MSKKGLVGMKDLPVHQIKPETPTVKSKRETYTKPTLEAHADWQVLVGTPRRSR